MKRHSPLLFLPLVATLLMGITWQCPAQSQSTDQTQIQETKKSAFQRRKEANDRLQAIMDDKNTLPAHKAPALAQPAPAKKSLAATPTPTGINPAVDISLPNYANSPNIRKFIDGLPGLGSANANKLGQYISVGTPDKNAYPGSDYYEIGLVRYFEKMNTDLPATDLRGYVQLETPANAAQSKHIALKYPNGSPILRNGVQVYAFENPMYLGPVIVAQKNTPVRVKFTNFLPLGSAGSLPLPVDTTVMGAGMGPLGMNVTPGKPMNYTQNRATIHLHGGLTPWISDGTPHQWITPSGENTDYPKGVAAQNVPDMPDPGPGSLNFYWTNQQSARLMFYHDHAYGITRLNVYAGEAAGYLLTDQVEEDLISGSNVSGANPALAKILPDLGGVYHNGIPLVIQDKTFVNDATTKPDVTFPTTATATPKTAVVDPLWTTYVPGTTGGNLWLPHEYLPNENIYNASGFNLMGRWDYGPWMIPAMTVMNNTLPSPTIIPESYMDTPIVNGTAYPYLELPPTAVRFRILNACNDRMLNLQLYKTDPLHPTEVKMVDAVPNSTYPASWPKDGRDGGVPDPALAGPTMYQIGNECGFLAKVAVVPPQPVDYDYNRRSVTFGGVTSKSLLLPPAVRADVVVDFSSYKDGDTLILYNDAPAPMPLYDTRNDYYTGDPDQTSIGGAPTTQEGFGPNTRTIMQVRIKGTASPTYDVAALQNALPKAFAVAQDAPLVPESAYNQAYGTSYSDTYANAVDESLNLTGVPQPVASVVTELPGLGYTTPPTVSFYGGGGTGAAATASLNGVAGLTLLTAGTGYTSAPTVTITGGGGTGATAAATVSGGVVTVLTVINPGSNYTTAPTVTLTGGGGTGATAQANITLGTVGAITVTNPGAGYTSAPRVYLTGGGGSGATAGAVLRGAVIMNGKNLVEGMDMEYGRMNAVLGSTPSPLAPTVGAGPVVGAAHYIDPPTELLDAGTTLLWRISHIGVDSHALHFHLFNVQVVNRVDWTNTVKPPYDDELGWKETIRTNPFEDIIVAIKPVVAAMKLPFGSPDSSRLLDPTMPAGSTASFLPVAPPPGIPAVAQTTNVITNFGWEYVWHCHLLGHEENDMMRPMVFNVPRTLPGAPALSLSTTSTSVTCNWTDPTPVASSTTPGNPANEIGFLIMRGTGTTGALAQIGTAPANSTSYVDQTVRSGSTYRYQITAFNAAGNNGSNIVTAVPGLLPPAAPTFLTATVQAGPRVALAFTDNATTETGFSVERALNGGAFTQVAALPARQATGTVNYSDTTVASNNTYDYRVKAMNAGGSSAYSNVARAVIPNLPVVPTGLTGSALASAFTATATLRWVDTPNETSYSIQRSTSPQFGSATTTSVPANTITVQQTGLQRGRTYYFRIAAVNQAGVSAWSAPITVTTP